jgi:hypothetical protein
MGKRGDCTNKIGLDGIWNDFHCSLYFIPAFWYYCLQPSLLHRIAFVSSQPYKLFDLTQIEFWVPGMFVNQSGPQQTFGEGGFPLLSEIIDAINYVFQCISSLSKAISSSSHIYITRVVILTFFLPRYVEFRVQGACRQRVNSRSTIQQRSFVLPSSPCTPSSSLVQQAHTRSAKTRNILQYDLSLYETQSDPTRISLVGFTSCLFPSAKKKQTPYRTPNLTGYQVPKTRASPTSTPEKPLRRSTQIPWSGPQYLQSSPTMSLAITKPAVPEKKPVKFSNLLLGAGLNM